MRKLLAYFILSFPLVLTGQTHGLPDTLFIDEILIRESPLTTVISGFRNKTVDSLMIKENSLGNLSDLISENTSLFIKSYGPGSISTISFRGTGATHTQLLWNELSINSPMLGQADLSLIPAGFLDEIRIFHGGASMIIGNGGLGGTINLETKPDWDRGMKLLFNTGAGSFGRFSTVMKARVGSENFQSVTRVFYNAAQNDFTYLNSVGYPEPVAEQRQNAAISQKSVMQELYFKSRRSITSANFWYQSTDRELPSTLLVPQTGGAEKQYDESFRAVVSHKSYFDRSGLDAALAWFSDRLDYTNIPASINSRNLSNSLFAKAGFEASISEKTSFKALVNNEFNFVNSVNYNGHQARYLTTATASVRKVMGDRLGMVFLIREIFDDFRPLTPDFSMGLDLMVLKKEDGFLRINLSRNSKVPTMNDRYWNPGGNPDLKNEYSYTGEISFDMKGNLSSQLNYNAELTAHSGRIRDLIQWVPGSSGYWSPQNVAQTGTGGIETDLGLVYRVNQLQIKINGIYSYTRSFNMDNNGKNDGNQLIYIPVHILNGGFRAGFRNSYAGINTGITGKRFTTVENDQFLPGYNITNLLAGYKLKAGSSSFDFSIKAENIFNVRYEVIAYYPMPGRSFLISLTYQLAN